MQDLNKIVDYHIGKFICDNKITTFEQLKTELSSQDETGNSKYNLQIKEDDDLAIIFYANDNTKQPIIDSLEWNTKSIIIEKSTLKPIVTHYNNMIYNIDTLNFISSHINNSEEFQTKFMVQPSYEGTMVIVFNYKDKWYVTTRRCLDADKSIWVKDVSYKMLFDDAVKDKNLYDKLDKNLCYHFVLIHHKNNNIVKYYPYNEKSYPDFCQDLLLKIDKSDYAELIHVGTTKQYTLENVDIEIEGITKIGLIAFKTLDEMIYWINIINQADINSNTIRLEGFIVKYLDDNMNLKIMKLQTQIYANLTQNKANSHNIYRSFIKMFQTNTLKTFLPYFVGNEYKTNSIIINTIMNSIKTLSIELETLYKNTRKNKGVHGNEKLYDNLPGIYHKVLYDIHGMYIKNRKTMNHNEIFALLKNIDSETLINLIIQRNKIINDCTKTEVSILFDTKQNSSIQNLTKLIQ